MRKAQHRFLDTLVKDARQESNLEETLNKFKLRDSLKNIWPVIFKNIKVMKSKERRKISSRLKETKEIRHRNAMCNPELDPFAIIKDGSGTTEI